MFFRRPVQAFVISLALFSNDYPDPPPTYTLRFFSPYVLVETQKVQQEFREFLGNHKRALENIPLEFRMTFAEVCFKYKIPPDLLDNLISHESEWKPTARSPINTNGTRDLGLMQLNSQYLGYFDSTFYPEGKLNPLNGKQNLIVGSRYLRFLRDETGSWEKALIAYNAGIVYVGRPFHKIPSITQLYIKKVLPPTI